MITFGLANPSPSFLLYFFSGVLIALFLVNKSRAVASKACVLRFGKLSLLFDLRILKLCISTSVLLFPLFLFGLETGEYPIPRLKAIATAFWDRNNEFEFVVNSLRLPRVLTAMLTGFCLAISGALFQSLLGNPLVSPDVIGINSGAALCAVFVLAAGGDIGLLPWAAFVGAAVTALSIYSLSWKTGISPGRLILVGIAVNALLASGVTYVMVKYPIERVVAAARWQAGSLFGVSWTEVGTLSVSVIVLTPLALLLMRRLRILQLGDDIASGLGLRVEWERMGLIVLAAALAAVAVAAVGPLGFVALLVPHMVRLVVGQVTGGALLLTGLVGALFLLACDLVAQQLFAPTTLPVGIITAAIGGPYFLFILVRSNNAL